MKFGLTAFAVLLLATTNHWTTVTAQVQGPQVIIINNVAENENVDIPAPTASTTNTPATDLDSSTEGSSTDVPSNQRKAAKYIDDQMAAAKTAAQIASTMQPADTGDGKSKLLQFAIFERLWSEEVVRKKLQEQIEAIESKREPVEIIDPTTEQIEGKYFKF